MRRQCELLGITRSTVYYEPKQLEEEALRLKEEVMARIDYWHTALPCMGTRKLAVKLRTEGYAVGRKLVRTYMQEMGIHAVYPKPNLSKRNFKEAIVPYLLRNKIISFPNQAWSIDITYIKMQHGHMYLTAIIDWFSRRIMGWELSDTLETAPVLDAVRTAVERFGAPAIFNSDQGSQFTDKDYKAQVPGHPAKHGRQVPLGRQYHDRALVSQPEDRIDLRQRVSFTQGTAPGHPPIYQRLQHPAAS